MRKNYLKTYSQFFRLENSFKTNSNSFENPHDLDSCNDIQGRSCLSQEQILPERKILTQIAESTLCIHTKNILNLLFLYFFSFK